MPASGSASRFHHTLSDTALPCTCSVTTCPRHDIVHLNGKHEESEFITIGQNEFTELARYALLFTRSTDRQTLDGMQKDIHKEVDAT